MEKIFSLIFMLSLVSCATGPRYVPAPKAPEGKALVYLMRDSITYGGGYRTRYSVNDRIVAALYDRGYTWIYLDEGDHKIKVGSEISIRLKVDSGETHYVMYSQANKAIGGGFVNSANLLQPLKYERVADRLHKFRYKPSNDYATAKLTSNSDYSNDFIPNGAKLSLKLTDSASEEIKLNTYLIDDPKKCFYRRKHLNHFGYDGSLINIPTEGPQTILLQAKPKLSLRNAFFCSAYITFYPEQNENLELSFDISDKNGFKVCNASMINLSNQQVYKFVGRPRTTTASLASPRCSSKDLLSPEFITDFEFRYISN